MLEASQRRAIASEYLGFASMMAVANDPDAAAHHVPDRLPARAENRGVEEIVDPLMRKRGVAAVQHDDIGSVTHGDRAGCLRDCPRAAACSTRP